MQHFPRNIKMIESNFKIQCYINKKSNVEIMETVEIGLTVPECNASTADNEADGSSRIKLKPLKLVCLCRLLQMSR